jgi:hypothetical protein
MDTSLIVGWSGLVLSILGIIYSAINHKHCKVLLCGRRLEFGIDVDTTEIYEEERKKEEELKRKNEEEIKRKNEEEQKKKDEELKKKFDEEKRKISYTPHVFKIQPLNL